MPGVGEQLQRAREAQDLSLDEIAGSTRIGRAYLEALEEGRYEALPGRAFGKFYIRAYADKLGFDPDPILREYENELRSWKQPDETREEPERGRRRVGNAIAAWREGLIAERERELAAEEPNAGQAALKEADDGPSTPAREIGEDEGDPGRGLPSGADGNADGAVPGPESALPAAAAPQIEVDATSAGEEVVGAGAASDLGATDASEDIPAASQIGQDEERPARAASDSADLSGSDEEAGHADVSAAPASGDEQGAIGFDKEAAGSLTEESRGESIESPVERDIDNGEFEAGDARRVEDAPADPDNPPADETRDLDASTVAGTSAPAQVGTAVDRDPGERRVAATVRAPGWLLGLVALIVLAILLLIGSGIVRSDGGEGLDASPPTTAAGERTDPAGRTHVSPPQVTTPSPGPVEPSSPDEATETRSPAAAVEETTEDLAPSASAGSGPSALSVTEHGVGTGVAAHRLLGKGDRFSEGEVVAFQTRVVGGGPGDSVRHVWLREGRVQQTIALAVGSSSFRTHSTKTLWGTGAWTVEARDASGRVLARSSFTCSDGS